MFTSVSLLFRCFFVVLIGLAYVLVVSRWIFSLGLIVLVGGSDSVHFEQKNISEEAVIQPASRHRRAGVSCRSA